MASIRQRDGRWQARITIKGFSSVAKTFTTKADAVAWAKVTESEMIRGTFIPRTSGNISLKDALARYQAEVTAFKRSASIETLRIAQWQRNGLAARSLADLRPRDFADYRDRRLRSGKAESTVRLELAIISHMFNIARKEWGCEGLGNPIASIRMPVANNERNRVFRAGEEAALLDALTVSVRAASGHFPDGCQNPYLRPLVELALATAMRRGELLALRWENIDLDRRVALLPMTKNGKVRNVPLSNKAAALLETIFRKDEGEVFPITANAVKLGFARALTRARERYLDACTGSGVTADGRFLVDLHFHDLRHIAVTRLAAALPNIVELAAVSGHNDVRMLKRYYHPSAEDLARKLG